MKLKYALTIVLVLVVGFCIGETVADGSTLVQGEKYTYSGTATGSPGSIMWYLFGPNYFNTGTSSVIEGTFEISLSKTETKNLAPGQYFLVIQHPMYDKVFNVGPVKTEKGYAIMLNNKGSYTDSSAQCLFYVNDRLAENAASALVDAITSQNIDDLFTTQTILVTKDTALSSDLAKTVVKGELLEISGTTTGHVNDVVTVELSQGDFSPVSKEIVKNSNTSAVSTTRIGASGAWSVNLDTTNLNLGKYTVSVTVGSLSPTKSTVEIIAPVPTEEPTKVPTQVTLSPTPTPTSSSTPVSSPWFGIMTIIGLGSGMILFRKH